MGVKYTACKMAGVRMDAVLENMANMVTQIDQVALLDKLE